MQIVMNKTPWHLSGRLPASNNSLFPIYVCMPICLQNGSIRIPLSFIHFLCLFRYSVVSMLFELAETFEHFFANYMLHMIFSGNVFPQIHKHDNVD